MLKIKLLVSCSIVVLLAACAGHQPGKILWEDPEYSLTWPDPPDQPRIRFLRAISGPGDLKSDKKSSKIITWLFGEQEEDIPLLNPFAVVADGSGKIWVADTGSHILYVFDLARNTVDYIEEINGRRLEYPTGLAYDGTLDRLYVSDSAREFISVLDSDGNYLAEWMPPSGFKRPTGMAIDASGHLYVADALAGEIFVFDAAGNVIREVGSQLSESGKFERPVNVAIGPAGEVLVVDAMSFLVEVQSSSGQSLGSLGRLGDAAGHFARPKGLAVSQQGYVFISDAAFDNIQVFDMAGNLMMYFGSAGRSPGQFNLPAGLYLDGNGRLYVADPYNKRIQVFQTLLQ